MRSRLSLLIPALLAFPLSAQQFPTEDPVIKRIWDEGMTDKSQIARLAQVLMDSIGPRLTASPGHQSAVQWLQNMYKSWGVPARGERYGTWRAWRRGMTHLDLIAPRFRTKQIDAVGQKALLQDVELGVHDLQQDACLLRQLAASPDEA